MSRPCCSNGCNQLVMSSLISDPGIKCTHLHPDTSCAYQAFWKARNALSRGAKFYLILHLIPFLLYKLRKINSWKKFKEEMGNFGKKYVGSLAFMAALVSGIKVFLCFSQKITKPQPAFEGKVFIWGSVLSSISIFFQDSHRRQEIVYFVFVRAARSAYQFCKKRHLIALPHEQVTIFIALFAILSVLFHEEKDKLKNRDLLQKIWGTA